MEDKAYMVESINMNGFEEDPEGWLRRCGISNGWILAYADDGVIWGIINNGFPKFSCNVFPKVSPPFRASTLQQLRIFNKEMELRVWRRESLFDGYSLRDGNIKETRDEDYILLGNKIEEIKDGFTLLPDGSRGLRHAVPIDISDLMNNAKSNKFQLTLTVRHYIDYEEDNGQAYISSSRMLGLKLNGEEVLPWKI